ncbi:Hypothetical protein R9X50_00263000 [Acrodontium crateriforme]|uniref:Uncharacterized protein n=1 Tax=Acrodontium crateriforme TaxID=150365 RepID=A0AAQ3M2I1_9PEZI|nr:Hypothetical protein R9X50_00263000 [Acrodontium crateriforme]
MKDSSSSAWPARNSELKSFTNPLPGSADDWNSCSLGPADQWPTSLQAYCVTLASFVYPAAIFWGEEFILLHNNAWERAGGISEQCKPQRGSLTADAWKALQAALSGGVQRLMTSTEILRSKSNPHADGGEYTVLISPLFATDTQAHGVMAQLIPPQTHGPKTMRREKPRLQGIAFDKAGLGDRADTDRTEAEWDEAVDGIPLDEHPFFHRFAEMLPSGLAILDHKANAVFVNQNFYQLTTHKHKDRSFTAWPDSIHDDDRARVLNAYNEAFKNQRQLRTEFRAVGDQLKWRLLLLTPLGNENLQHVSLREYGGFVCCIVDITSEKSAENRQRENAREARERKEQQERFIDMISHEIRNPLSAVMHCVEDIEDAIREKKSVDFDAIHEAIETINICISHQQHIVDDVLAFSKLDSAMLTLVPRPCQPSRQLNESLKMFQPEFRKQKVDFGYCIDTSYEKNGVDWVMADFARIGQVLVNLVSNAIKFTSRVEGKRNVDVIVGVSHERPASFPPNVVFFDSDERAYRMDATNTKEWETGDTTYILVAVKDTGIGISEEGQRKLFQRFRQATPKTEESYGGSGLGLLISRKICHLHGGEIGVSSKEGSGTTFGFFFKVRMTTKPEDRESKKLAEAKESAKFQQKIEQLGNVSPSMMDSSDMPDSVEKPRVMSSDDITPNEDGIRDERYQETIAIANDVKKEKADDKQIMNRNLSSDAVDHAQETNKQSESRPNKKEQAESDSPDVKKESKIHVLLVEDNLINQRIVARKLQAKGFAVTTANNGREAVDVFTASRQPSDAFKIILMDQEMPVMDGNAAARVIRNIEATETKKAPRRIPILGVSANVRPEQQDEMLAAGMDDVIAKPYKIDEMMEKITMLMSNGS